MKTSKIGWDADSDFYISDIRFGKKIKSVCMYMVSGRNEKITEQMAIDQEGNILHWTLHGAYHTDFKEKYGIEIELPNGKFRVFK